MFGSCTVGDGFGFDSAGISKGGLCGWGERMGRGEVSTYFSSGEIEGIVDVTIDETVEWDLVGVGGAGPSNDVSNLKIIITNISYLFIRNL